MDEKTLEALDGSIAKWDNIAEGREIDRAQDNCPLCQLFFYGGCEGCPVFEDTGQSQCANTPYQTQWAKLDPAKQHRVFIDDIGGIMPDGGWKAVSVHGRRVARREANYLRGLRPKGRGANVDG